MVRFILVVAAKPHASLPPHNFFTNFPCARATGSRMFALPNNHAGGSILGDWHSWLARFVHIEEVAGSSPASPTANAGSGFGISVFLFWLPNWLPNKRKFGSDQVMKWKRRSNGKKTATVLFWQKEASSSSVWVAVQCFCRHLQLRTHPILTFAGSLLNFIHYEHFLKKTIALKSCNMVFLQLKLTKALPNLLSIITLRRVEL